MAERKKSKDSSKMLDIQPRLGAKIGKLSEMSLLYKIKQSIMEQSS